MSIRGDFVDKHKGKLTMVLGDYRRCHHRNQVGPPESEESLRMCFAIGPIQLHLGHLGMFRLIGKVSKDRSSNVSVCLRLKTYPGIEWKDLRGRFEFQRMVSNENVIPE